MRVSGVLAFTLCIGVGAVTFPKSTGVCNTAANVWAIVSPPNRTSGYA